MLRMSVVIAGLFWLAADGSAGETAERGASPQALLERMRGQGRALGFTVPDDAPAAPATPQAKAVAHETVEDLLKKEQVFLYRPNINGVPFLAVSVGENTWYEAEASQLRRGKAVCELLGFAEPTVTIIEWQTSNRMVLLVDEKKQNVMSRVEEIREFWPKLIGYATFSRLGCRKRR